MPGFTAERVNAAQAELRANSKAAANLEKNAIAEPANATDARVARKRARLAADAATRATKGAKGVGVLKFYLGTFFMACIIARLIKGPFPFEAGWQTPHGAESAWN
jgi:hypothetical protein